MKPEKKIEALAKLEFGDSFYCVSQSDSTWIVTWRTDKHLQEKKRNYLVSLDALRPFLEGMDTDTLFKYSIELMDMLGPLCVSGSMIMKLILAKPERVAEAILKAYGKWEEKEPTQ